MHFTIKAVRGKDQIVSLNYQALDENDAIHQAQSQGYTVLAVRAKGGMTKFNLQPRQRYPISLFSQELQVLLNSGLPLVDSLEALAEKERNRGFRSVIERIVISLKSGQTFSTALKQFPNVFPVLYVATVQASEKTGDLPQALSRFVAYQNQVDLVRKKIINASIYPLVLMFVGGLVTLFLLVFVMPKFSSIYADRVDLPWSAQILVSWGKLIQGKGAIVLGVFLGGIVLLFNLIRSARFWVWVMSQLSKIPAIGERVRTYQLARLYRTIGMLLNGGIPAVTAIDMSMGLLDPQLKSKLTQARREIAEGRSISQSMERYGLTTSIASRMLAVGERSGKMGDMMEQIARFHDDEIALWIDRFSRTFEPLMMLMIGIVIGCIVVLMYMPIFELAGNLQ